MLSRRCVRGGMSFILPFMFTQLLAMMCFSGAESEAGRHFDCYNDYVSVFCHFTPPNVQTNCSEYTVNITLIATESCGFKHEDGPTAECKCSLKHPNINLHDDLTATLLRGGQQLKSIAINIYKSLKPQAPTITVNKSGMGNFKVTWDTHYSHSHSHGHINNDLIALVTYGKKGDSTKISRNVSSTHSFEMKELDPSSVYVVTVRTRHLNSSLLSDSSNEEEFTTPPSAHTRLKGLIIGLCIAVVIVSCTVLCCYAKYKAKYWDNIPKCYSNLLTMVPASEQMFLQPPQPIISSVYLDSTEKDEDEDNQWSEVFTNDGNHQESYGSTTEPSLGYPGKIFPDNGNIIANVHAALRQAIPHLTMTSSETDSAVTSPNSDYGGNDLSLMSGALSFDNGSYNSCQKDMISGSYATQMRPELSDGPGCHRREGDISIHGCPDPKTLVGLVTSQQGLNIQLGPSSPIQADISHQPCHADSGSISPQENASLALISNGSDVCVPCRDVSPRAEAGYESFNEAVSGGRNIPPENTSLMNREEAQVCDDGRLLSLSPVDMDYQAFPNQLTQVGPSRS